MKEKNIIVTIQNLDHQGRGIAKGEKIIFVENALPGETVEIKIIKEKKKIAIAKPIKWIQTSQARVTPPCPYYKECGGCDLQHITYETELAFKQQKVKEILSKFASYQGTIAPIIESEKWNYRNKITLHVKNGKICLLKRESNEGVYIDHCLLVHPEINELIKKLNQLPLNTITSITIRKSTYTNDRMVILETEEKIKIDALKDYATAIIQKKKENYITLYGNNTIQEKLHDLIFEISAPAFFQVNTKQAEKLYQKVLESGKITKNDHVLDLYCGTGTIGIFISQYAHQVIGIEQNVQAIENALQNKQHNQIQNIEFYCGDVGKVLKDNQFYPDIIIVDPPRAGLSQEALEQIKKINAQRIVYVSCDPVTLARDIKALTNYKLMEITPVDMFPNTMHVECVSLLHRKEMETNSNYRF